MELTPQESLIKAANFIKEGRTKSARSILLSILREDKENAQAWFMLSYSIPDLEKQIFAVKQALIYKPDSAKAQRRLSDLTGELPPDSTKPAITEDKSLTDQFEEYSQPIFPSTTKEAEKKDQSDLSNRQPEAETDPLEALRSSMDDYQHYQFRDQEPTFTPRVDEIRKEIEEREMKSRVFGIRRSQFFLGAAAFVVIISIILLVASSIRREFSRTSTSSSTTSTNTIAPTPETVATESISEPVAVPSPTELPIPALQPEVASDVFNWNSYSFPGGITQEKMNQVTNQLLVLINSDIAPGFKTYTISELELQGLIYAFPKLPEFNQQVSNTIQFYQAIGLASPEDDYSSLFANFWVDPNGTLVIPQDQAIAVFGYDFSNYQKYSYAQGVMQIIRRSQFPEASIFSVELPCYLPTEKCDIWNAVIKGEAAFTASQWASENMDTETYQSIFETKTKYTFTPISPSPNDFMDTLIRSPYQHGFSFAEAVFQAQGWAGLENIYKNPPRSTEQILHPEKYIAGEEPTGIITKDLGDILGEEWEPLFKGPLGEWKTYLMLAYNPNPLLRIETETASRAAAGWNGDQAQIFSTSEGTVAILFHWAWDTSGEQAQFESVLREYASRMVGGLEAQFNNITCEVSTYQTSCILPSAEETIWVLAPDLDTASMILENYSFSGE